MQQLKNQSEEIQKLKEDREKSKDFMLKNPDAAINKQTQNITNWLEQKETDK